MDSLVARLHRIGGIITVIAFMATGVFMKWRLPPLDVSTHLTRMLFRSAHIYLLLAGLINITIGSYLVPAASRWAQRYQAVGSLLLLVSPAVILISFFYESPRANLERPMIRPAVMALLLGTTLHFLAARRTRSESGTG